jgi:CheY-like chemotaxis protein
MVRETITLLLEDDYQVGAAVSVRSALALLLAQDAPPFDLILLDCLLPDGRVAELLTEADRRAIPVVLISGDPRQADAVDPSRPFLSKPFSLTALMAALDSARR